MHTTYKIGLSLANATYNTGWLKKLAQLFVRLKINELCHLWSYWTKVNEIFTRYRGIIFAVNAHTEVGIAHSVSEC